MVKDYSVKSLGTVAIMGVGLIGGSIGLAIRERGLSDRVIGIGRNQAKLRKARQKGAVTETTTRIDRGVSEADIVFVCTPGQHVIEHVKQISEYVGPDTLITDVGSTKQTIVEGLSGLGNGHFIGSHPMAGSDQGGVTNAEAELFVKRTVIITPQKGTGKSIQSRITRIWKSIGAQVIALDCVKHDRAVAVISHLPHAIATVLSTQANAHQMQLAAGGWIDTTRIAGADPDLWLAILRDNNKQVIRAVDRFMSDLHKFRDALESDNSRVLLRYLNQGKQNRESLGN